MVADSTGYTNRISNVSFVVSKAMPNKPREFQSFVVSVICTRDNNLKVKKLSKFNAVKYKFDYLILLLDVEFKEMVIKYFNAAHIDRGAAYSIVIKPGNNGAPIIVRLKFSTETIS